jgi:hypothetical protein
MPPGAMPPGAMPPGAKPPGDGVAPPQRPPKRYRAWPWLLSIVVVIGLVCGGGYLMFRPDPPGDPLSGRRTIAIPDLAPVGYRQSIVTGKKAYAIGQRTDGRVEVVTVDLATGAEVRHQSEPAGDWASARLVGDWVVVFSTPAADGTRRVALSNGVDDKHTTVTLGKDEDLTFRGVDPGTNDLNYLLYSPGTGTVRDGLIGGPTPTSSRPVALPRGARLMSDLRLQQEEVVFVDPTGQIYAYNGGVSLDQPSTHRAPPGHPPTLVHYSTSDSSLYVAEDKLEYQVLRDGSPVYRGPADRQPVWIGACGSRQDRTCVVDQRPNDPVSREILTLSDSRRGAAAHADVPGWVLGATSSLYDVLIVPTREGETIGTLIVNLGGRSHGYAADLWLVDGGNGILVPTRPAGAAADWAATPQQVDFKSVSLAGERVRSIGTQTVRPGSCYADAGRLACAGVDDYSVWSVRL